MKILLKKTVSLNAAPWAENIHTLYEIQIRSYLIQAWFSETIKG